MKLTEVPKFLKKMYAVAVSYGAVCRWARDGVLRKVDKQMIYLNTTKLGRWRFVTKADLLKFLEEMK